MAAGDPPATPQDKAAGAKPSKTIGDDSVRAAVTSFALAPAGDLVALGGDDGQIRFWSLATDKVTRILAAYQDKKYIGCLAFSPDGKRLAFQADDEPVRLWDLEADKEVGRLSEELFIIDQICFSPDAKRIGIVSDSVGYVWNIESNKTTKLDQPVNSMAFSPDGKTLALGFNTVRLVEAENGRAIKEVGKMTGAVTALRFHPAGVQVLALDGSCPGTTIRMLDTVNGKETILAEKIPLSQIGAAYSADGKTIAASDGAGKAIFWDVSSGSKIGTLAGLDPRTDTLIYMPGGKSLLAATTQQGAAVQVWDLSGIVRTK
jgi:WD40 repeat protein